MRGTIYQPLTHLLLALLFVGGTVSVPKAYADDEGADPQVMQDAKQDNDQYADYLRKATAKTLEDIPGEGQASGANKELVGVDEPGSGQRSGKGDDSGSATAENENGADGKMASGQWIFVEPNQTPQDAIRASAIQASANGSDAFTTRVNGGTLSCTINYDGTNSGKPKAQEVAFAYPDARKVQKQKSFGDFISVALDPQQIVGQVGQMVQQFGNVGSISEPGNGGVQKDACQVNKTATGACESVLGKATAAASKGTGKIDQTRQQANLDGPNSVKKRADTPKMNKGKTNSEKPPEGSSKCQEQQWWDGAGCSG